MSIKIYKACVEINCTCFGFDHAFLKKVTSNENVLEHRFQNQQIIVANVFMNTNI
jgi:hypothetical protein